MIFLTVLIFLAACAAAGATGTLFQPGEWYQRKKRPAFTPPNWVFPVVWTTLYVLMAWAAARLAAISGSGIALALWSLQIALNTLWTPLFFQGRGPCHPWPALADGRPAHRFGLPARPGRGPTALALHPLAQHRRRAEPPGVEGQPRSLTRARPAARMETPAPCGTGVP